jgi:hypothetical protein
MADTMTGLPDKETYTREEVEQFARDMHEAGFIQGQAQATNNPEQETKGLQALQRILKEY